MINVYSLIQQKFFVHLVCVNTVPGMEERNHTRQTPGKKTELYLGGPARLHTENFSWPRTMQIGASK